MLHRASALNSNRQGLSLRTGVECRHGDLSGQYARDGSHARRPLAFRAIRLATQLFSHNGGN